MKILFYMSDESGCGFYRMSQPATFIDKIKGFECAISNYTRKEDIEWADVIVWQRQYYSNIVFLTKAIKKHYPEKIQVAEIDDLFEFLEPSNPAYREYNTNGQQPLRNMNEIRRTVDMITVSTKYLANRYEHICPVYVLPNSLDFDLWKFEKKENDKIRIGWSGSETHEEDLMEMGDVLKQIAEEFKDKIEICVLGFAPDTVFEGIKNLKLKGYVKMKDFPAALKEMNFDIALAPLKDKVFNKAKSNIKYLEASALSIPTIASNVGPYAETIVSGENGILVNNTFKDWNKAIRRLIRDKEYRIKLGKNACDFVHEHFDIRKNAKRWAEAYKQELDQKRATLIKKVIKKL